MEKLTAPFFKAGKDVYQMILWRISWNPFHDVRFRVFESKRYGWYDVRAEVDEKDCDCAERKWDADHNVKLKRRFYPINLVQKFAYEM